MRLLVELYYRFVFLRRNPISRAVTALVGQPPVRSAAVWDSEYQLGVWNRLKDLSEQAHTAVVLSYIERLRPHAKILEIGCGEGEFARRLREAGYKAYTGIDISHLAIERSQRWSDERTVFLAANAEIYVPTKTFDVIVLNESIYYFREPVRTLERYALHLEQNGLFVISMFDAIHTRPVYRCLTDGFEILDETLVSNSRGAWRCLVMTPKRPVGEGEHLSAFNVVGPEARCRR